MASPTEQRKKAMKKLRFDSGSPNGILLAVIKGKVVVDFNNQDAVCLSPHEAMAFSNTLAKNALKAGYR